jgi:hypothetical protein
MMKRSATHQPETVLPTVNLLSPWSFEALSTRRLRQRFSVGCLALMLVVAAGWGVQSLRINQSQEELTVAQADSGLLAAETQSLAPVATFVAAVAAQKATVQETMTREIYFSSVLDALQAATPSGAQVESAIVALNPVAPPAPAPAPDAEAGTPVAAPEAVVEPSLCPGPDPFNTLNVVGCITLSGSAENRRAVGDLVIGLGDSTLFVEPFITATTSADETGVTFTGSVGLSEKVFSNRYADLDTVLDGAAL